MGRAWCRARGLWFLRDWMTPKNALDPQVMTATAMHAEPGVYALLAEQARVASDGHRYRHRVAEVFNESGRLSAGDR